MPFRALVTPPTAATGEEHADQPGRCAPVSGASVQAVHGMAGMGKTTTAIEYAHRHGDDYDVA